MSKIIGLVWGIFIVRKSVRQQELEKTQIYERPQQFPVSKEMNKLYLSNKLILKWTKLDLIYSGHDFSIGLLVHFKIKT